MCAEKGLILAWSRGKVYLEHRRLWRLLLLRLSDDHGGLMVNPCLLPKTCQRGHTSVEILSWDSCLSSWACPVAWWDPYRLQTHPSLPHPQHPSLCSLTLSNQCTRRNEVRRIAVQCLRCYCQHTVAHIPPHPHQALSFNRLVMKYIFVLVFFFS